MDSYPYNPHVQRAMADINESRNERQKCVLLRALGRHLRAMSRSLVAETTRLRNEGMAQREEGCPRKRD